MSTYDNPLENVFKSQLHVTRGRGRSSSKGRGGQTANHRDNKNDSESEEKTQKNPPSLRGSSNRSWQQGNQRYDKSKVQCYYCNTFCHYTNKCWKKQAYARKQSPHMTYES
jgi:hypothetical protein